MVPFGRNVGAANHAEMRQGHMHQEVHRGSTARFTGEQLPGSGKGKNSVAGLQGKAESLVFGPHSLPSSSNMPGALDYAHNASKQELERQSIICQD